MCMNYVPDQLKRPFCEQLTSVFDVSRNGGASKSESRGFAPMRSDLRAAKGTAETGSDWDRDAGRERDGGRET